MTGGTPAENSQLLISLLSGELSTEDPVENFVVLNAAALLLVSGVVKDEREGVSAARKSIREGGALRSLEEFRRVSQKAVLEMELEQ